MLSFTALALASLTAPLAGDSCTSKGTAMLGGGDKDIVQTAVAAGSFNTLAKALGAAGLVEALQGDGPFTVFAPSDEAFAKLPAGTVENLLKPENKAQLQAVLTYHVVPGAVAAVDVVELSGATTLNGQRIGIASSDQGVTVDGARVVKTDIRCSNGIIHVIDAVILPSSKDLVKTAVEAGSFGTLAKALGAAGLVDALQGEGPFTVFAPTDEAFAKLPAGTLEDLLKPENRAKLVAILKFHVVPGRVFSDAAAKGATVSTLQGGELTTRSERGAVLVNGARVVSADIDASNGVIHVIDRVLLPE